MKTFPLPTPIDGKDVWRDRKRYLWPLGLVVPSLPFLAALLRALTGTDLFLWLGPVVLLAVVPLVDLVAGNDPTNPPDAVIDALEEDRYYRWVTYLYLPLQYSGFVYGMWITATGGVSVQGRIGMAFTLGTVVGVAINTAHELGHKRDDLERWLGKIALAQCAYGHFYIEHNRGHHVRVATPEDPASSRMGESFYRFWPRTVAGSLRSAWQVERKRYKRRDTHPFHLGNDVINAWLMTVVLWGAVIAWLGAGVLPYLAIQAVFGFSLLEIVNYMEHYGMLRQKVQHGSRQRYERVTPTTSVELQQHRHQRPAVPPAAPQRPPRQPHPALPDPARFRRESRPADRLHGHDDRRSVPAAVPAPHGPAGGRPLRGRHPPRQRPARQARKTARQVPHAIGRTRHCGRRRPPGPHLGGQRRGRPLPGLRSHVCRRRGQRAGGLRPCGTPWSQIPDDWTCPDCGVREKADFIPLTSKAA